MPNSLPNSSVYINGFVMFSTSIREAPLCCEWVNTETHDWPTRREMYDYEVFEFKRNVCIVFSTAQKIQQKSEQKDYVSQRLGRGTVWVPSAHNRHPIAAVHYTQHLCKIGTALFQMHGWKTHEALPFPEGLCSVNGCWGWGLGFSVVSH